MSSTLVKYISDIKSTFNILICFLVKMRFIKHTNDIMYTIYLHLGSLIIQTSIRSSIYHIIDLIKRIWALWERVFELEECMNILI